MRLTPGTRLGTYEVLSALGAGGMGEVYLARDSKLGRDVALKVLPAEVASDPDRLSRFEREARTVAALNHPNIVTLHAVEEAQGTAFLVMERINGRALSDLIPPGGLEIARLVEIAAPIAAALAAAHDKSIVHRDLKPANVMVTDDGLVKVLDFGLAKIQAPAQLDASVSAETATQPSRELVVGTVPYMSPEQLRGEQVDARTDIFSFGAVLYEMATGIRPFRGESAADVMSAILRQEPPPLETVRAGLPPRLVRLVKRCLEKNPRHRVQSAIDLSHELDDLNDELRASHEPAVPSLHTAGGPTPAEPVDSGRASRSKRWRTRLLAAFAVVAVVTLAIGVIGMLTRSTGSGPGGDRAIRSLAVLPFENMNHDASQDYFVDGMHEALINDLARLGTLKVISRNSVVRYRGTAAPPKDVARELGVDALVAGSVLRAGNQVRVTAQLILGKSDEQVWGNSYDRDLQDVLRLLSDVSRAIAGEVRAKLGGAALPVADSAPRSLPRVRPEAYDAFLRGRQLMNVGLGPSLKAALEQYKLATDLDPTFARAWGELAAVHLMRAVFATPTSPESLAECRRAMQTALDLDPIDGAGLAVKGMLLLYVDWNFSLARASLERAVELNPHDATLRHGLADYLMVTGRFGESLEQVKIGRDANPTAAMPETIVIFHTLATRRFDDVIAEARRAMTVIPSIKALATSQLADALWRQERFNESLAETENLWGADSEEWRVLDGGYRRGGPRGAMRAHVEFMIASAKGPLNPLVIAGMYADAGDRDKAMEWLEKAFAVRMPTLLHVVASPSFDSMHDDRRYQNLLRRIGIPAGSAK